MASASFHLFWGLTTQESQKEAYNDMIRPECQLVEDANSYT